MNSISIFNNTIPIRNSFQIHTGNITNQSLHFSNLIISKVAESKMRRNDSIYNNIPRSKRRAQQAYPRNIRAVFAASKNNTPSLSTSSNMFEELINSIDLNDNSINDDHSLNNDVPSPSRGLQNNNGYPTFLTDAKNKLDLILTQLQSLNQITQEKNWEDLAKTLKAIKEYQYVNFENIDVMKESFESIFKLFSKTSIKTKSQFLVFENWLSILSYGPSSSISLKNNPKQAEVYLSRLHEILTSTDKEVQDGMHNRANILFKYEFLERCSHEEYASLRGKLFNVVKETFNLFETFKEKSCYYFIRNGLISYKYLIEFSEKTTFKEDVIYILEREFEDFFQKDDLTSAQKIVVKQLFYLATKKQNLPSLSKFCQRLTVKDMYPHQQEIIIENMRVNVSSSLPFSNSVIAQIPKKLEETRSYFIETFKEVINNQGNNTFDLFIAKDKLSYETFNYALLGTDTGNGGVLNYLSTPTITVYLQDGEVLNLKHECNHALFDFHIGFRDKVGKYGRLTWLNEGLSYVLVPDNFVKETVKRALTGKEFPSIKNIIEATNQDYDISYVFAEYLLKKQKPILEGILILMDKKNKQNALLIDKLGKLTDLEADFHAHLKNRWFPEGVINSTEAVKNKPNATKQPIAVKQSIATTKPATEYMHAEGVKIEHVEWSPDKGWKAVKQITYGSGVCLGLALTYTAGLAFFISKRKGRSGRAHGHRRPGNGDAINNLELHPLQKTPGKKKNSWKKGFSRNDSSHLQRSNRV